jgi:hypothetical protein
MTTRQLTSFAITCQLLCSGFPRTWGHSSLKCEEKENEERNIDVETSTSSIPIGDGTKTGKLSRPVSDNSQNGIDRDGSTKRPTLAKYQSLAFLTFDLT